MQQFTWKPANTCKPYIMVEQGKHECFVRTEPLAKGYLWQVNKFYGFEPTIEEAKMMAEEQLRVYLIKF